MYNKEISLKIIKDDNLLRHYAIKHKMEISHGGTPRIKEKSIPRWVVNYIRHCLTNYDTLLQYQSEYDPNELKESVLYLIAEHYPRYRNECYRQIREIY